MRTARCKISESRLAIWFVSSAVAWVQAQSPIGTSAAEQSDGTKQIQPIDLATALRLAGAQNLDVQIARQRLEEAKANFGAAQMMFFPWLSPGVGYRRHEDHLQDITGTIIDADKQVYSAGASLTAQWEFGDAIYKTLSAKQLANAANHAFDAQRQKSAAEAAQAYFEMLFAQAAVGVSDDAVRISQDYHAQVERAVEAGIAFRGDALRVAVQTERDQLARHQAVEQRRLAAARLAQSLHLDPATDLLGKEDELLPLTLTPTNSPLASLVQRAMADRPETKQSQSQIAAAKNSRNGAVYGPLIPSLGAQAFAGGLGGGRNDATGNFGPSEDYGIALSWRIGPGGLLDTSRKKSANARLQLARLDQIKLQDDITTQVVEAFTRWHSVADQMATTERALNAAKEGLRLAQERKQFGVGVVLEAIQAEQDLTRTRLDHLKAVVEFDKAQYALSWAIGVLH